MDPLEVRGAEETKVAQGRRAAMVVVLTMALRKIDLMHKFFGICEGHACRECSNLVEELYHGRKYIKCKVYGLTNSAASDWAKRYLACGMFNKEYKGRPNIERVRPVRTNKEEAQRIELEGQMKLEV